MLPSPSRAPSALPDMTLYWGRRRELTAEQTLGDHRGTRPGGGAGSDLGPRTKTIKQALSGRAELPHTPGIKLSRKAFCTHANVQVTKLVTYCLVVLLFLLTLTAKPAMAKRPSDDHRQLWIQEQPTHVIFRYQICQPKSLTDLERQCREIGCQVPTPVKRDPDADYQLDEPQPDWESEDDRSPADDLETDLVNGDMKGEELEDEKPFMGRRTSFQTQKKKLKRGLARRGQKKLTRGKVRADSEEGGVLSSILLMRNMKKRRRSAEIPESSAPSREGQEFKDFAREDSYDRLANDVNAAVDKKIDPHLTLVTAKSKARRKHMKQQIRNQIRTGKRENPPWYCNMTTFHREDPNVFPSSYQDGECPQSNCFYNLYECRAKKIQVKVLYRNSTACNPLPNLSNSTVYEERWELETRHATVFCECANKLSKSGRSGG